MRKTSAVLNGWPAGESNTSPVTSCPHKLLRQEHLPPTGSGREKLLKQNRGPALSSVHQHGSAACYGFTSTFSAREARMQAK